MTGLRLHSEDLEREGTDVERVYMCVLNVCVGEGMLRHFPALPLGSWVLVNAVCTPAAEEYSFQG